MKFNPVTLILVVVAVLLGGVVAVTQFNPSASETAAESDGTQLFGFEEDQVNALTVQTQLRSLQFQKDRNGQWQMQQPEQDVASDAAVAYLLNLLATGQSDRILSAPAANREDYGLHQPMATIEVTLDNNTTHQLLLGGYDFNRSLIYAQVDPPAEAGEELQVLLVSPDFDSAVNRPLAEWKVASESATPTPSPTPPSPTPSATP